jgi:hypothetical protein
LTKLYFDIIQVIIIQEKKTGKVRKKKKEKESERAREGG